MSKKEKKKKRRQREMRTEEFSSEFVYEPERERRARWRGRYRPDLEEREEYRSRPYEREEFHREGGYGSRYGEGYERRTGWRGEPYGPEPRQEVPYEPDRAEAGVHYRPGEREDQEGVYGAPYGGRYGGRGRGYDRRDFYEVQGDWVTEDWRVPGPKTGAGPRGYSSDERIYDEVSHRLTVHGQLDASDIEVEVEEGAVWLKGQVEDRMAKRMAEDTAETVPGVWDVHNRLEINRPSQEE